MREELELIYGIHAVESLLKGHPADIVQLCVLDVRRDKRLENILQLAKKHDVVLTYVTRKDLDQMCEGRHQGVLAKVKGMPERDEGHLEEILQGLDVPPFLLILDSVTDPHNLGACLRSADAAGVHAVVVPKDKSAPLNAVAKKVASGAADHVPLIRVTNLARTMKWLQQYGVWIVGAAGETDTNIYQQDMKGPIAIAMGAEGSGLRRLTRDHCDHLVRIPMEGSVSSLNVSVATGICLFEALRQRSQV